MREAWHGGDGFSWRARAGGMVWRRLDFLGDLPDGGQEFLFERGEIWAQLCALGFPAPNLVQFHFGSYFARNIWLPGTTPCFLSSHEIFLTIKALQPAFQVGIFHGDLAPENLVFNGKGEFHWIDWINASSDRGICVRGRSAYVSPERGIWGRCTLASEIYALGKLIAYWSYGSPNSERLLPLVSWATHSLPQYRPSLEEVLLFLNELRAFET